MIRKDAMSRVSGLVFILPILFISSEGRLLAERGVKCTKEENDEAHRRRIHDSRKGPHMENPNPGSSTDPDNASGKPGAPGGQAAVGGKGGGGYGNSQTSAFGGASAADSSAEVGAREAGTESLHQAAIEHQTARLDRSGASYLNQDYDRISGIVGPLLSSPNTSQRSQGEQFLSQKATPPPKDPELYSSLGIDTNRDVLERGQEIADNLNKAAPEREKSGDQFQDQGEKALAAADKLDGFKKTADRRATSFSSLTGENTNLAARGSSTLPMDDHGVVDDRAGSGEDPNAKREGVTDSVLAKYDAKKSVFALNGAGNSDGRSIASLRDKLRAAVEAHSNSKTNAASGEAADQNAKSAFDSIFEGAQKSPVAGEGKAPDEPARGNSTFAMSGSDTDRAVKKLAAQLNGIEAASNEAQFGNSDVTIFARMSKCLVKAQIDKKIAH